MPYNVVIVVLVLFFNLWIWKILYFNIPLGTLVIFVTLILSLSLRKINLSNILLFFISLVLLLFFQWQTTERIGLTYLDNDEQRVQQLRLREYPPVFIKLGSTIVWIPVAYWFEGRRESIAFFRIQNNFSEAVDPNLYFFSSHPRERVGINEFEKFPYAFLPFFIFGLFLFIQQEKKALLIIGSLLPITLISFIGHNNPVGPFSLFPFLSVAIAQGSAVFYERILKESKTHRALYLNGGLLVLFLILLQTIGYESY